MMMMMKQARMKRASIAEIAAAADKIGFAVDVEIVAAAAVVAVVIKFVVAAAVVLLNIGILNDLTFVFGRD